MRLPPHPIRASSALLLVLTLAAGCRSSGSGAEDAAVAYGGGPARLFDGMGEHSRPVSTSSAEAQRYFDQGLAWAYAFNHDEAVRSFTRAAELDPACAMAWWGVAWCQGPNYNAEKMSPARNAAAWAALDAARAQLAGATPLERALIEALGRRYAADAPKDRRALDEAYADAMRSLWEANRGDSDLGTLYAEALMILAPWKLYSKEGEPAEHTPQIVAALDAALAADPTHPGANHLYVHAVEASSTPELGLAAADRLGDLVPASGHLQHMPSHIYARTGKWAEAVVRNQRALEADVAYRALVPEQRTQLGYIAHDAHTLVFAAMMSGREREALATAQAIRDSIPLEAIARNDQRIERVLSVIYDVRKRFGRWDELLAEPAPAAELEFATTSWHASRAVAFAARKDFAAARRELDALRALRASLEPDERWGRDPAALVLEGAEHFVAGEIALHEGDLARAASELERSAELEDELSYGEPPKWLQPVRHALGAVLLELDRPEDAERVFREDLAEWPENGWSLYGLSRALRASGRESEAVAVEERFARAWSHADEPTTTSCKCVPSI